MSDVVRNLFFVVGVGCLVAGLALYSISLALSVLGALLLVVWGVAFWHAAKNQHNARGPQ